MHRQRKPKSQTCEGLVSIGGTYLFQLDHRQHRLRFRHSTHVRALDIFGSVLDNVAVTALAGNLFFGRRRSWTCRCAADLRDVDCC
jgi:hypothetical protein